ncbi:NAD-dependent succinate-semialdehyde dehydrogenase [Hydrocarboniclastica marina]|uniref:NAD-dependent succinate-semialdehyde dehydrogenase n=1 Tax=Hydrocarboniclastica marina TaxID=2259620 RepID=A0A4P7XLA5_9ALTE|nr:NAD-dependent succinate-semialdehyde dehydrogenase [Hydrocarboniclastica marina]MAM00366.1 NAD-dependent succinate-semialdehyde dehydrogenase [Alteromonadaceae bacterium]QCF27633.1 NAD-dependent succinate-semialdehyde dehydrogenase [Hydrocarboniclastica marina]
MIESPLLQHLSGYIGGQWTPAETGKTFDIHNPSTGEKLASVPSLGADEVNQAVAAGKEALQLTRPYTMEQRRHWLEGIRDVLMAEKKEVGRILSLEHGKPWKEAQAEVEYAAGFFDHCAKNLDQLEPHTLDERPKDCTWTVYHRPIGVVGLITPWNFPIGMIAKKLSAALAAGCPCVIKPASATPLTMIALFSLIHERLDLPKGMVNLVMGSAGVIGDTLCAHPDVPMLSFTGSTEIGQKLIEKTIPQVKKLGLELGGNAPFIVFADADLDAAADNLIANKFRGSGQTCVCANRILVQKDVADAFAEKVVSRVEKLRVGDGMDENVDIGPLINADGFDKVRSHVKDALEKGARQLAGTHPDELDSSRNLFYPPTVVTDVRDDMECWQKETFGPLVPMALFETEDDAVRAGNNTEYGLAAYVFTADDALAQRVIGALRFGHVGWNTGTGPAPQAPFGGMKASGIGREGGAEGLMEFVEAQAVPRGA